MRLFLLIASLVFTILSVVILYKEGYSIEGVSGVVLFSLATLFFVFQDRWDKWSDQKIKKNRESSHCILENDRICFPKGYYFKYGFLKSRKDLPFNVIEEVRLNTIPIAARIKGNELIFLKGLKDKDILGSTLKNKISKPQDHWALICEEFLDTELDIQQQEFIQNSLDTYGFSRSEINRIKDRIRLRMLIRTYISWEWLYYGQYDVLNELWPLNEEKYWWTMDIALQTETKSSKNEAA